jgi:HSP20 family protein
MRLVRYTYPASRNLAPVARVFRHSPWSGLEGEIDRLFHTALSDFGQTAATTRFPADLYADKDNIYVRAELPGVNRADINVEMVDGHLTIAATRKTPAPAAAADQAGEKQNDQPGETFSFSRSVSIADEIQTDKVAAAYENGVLTVTLPKREEIKPKKITVAVK